MTLKKFTCLKFAHEILNKVHDKINLFTCVKNVCAIRKIVHGIKIGHAFKNMFV